MFKVKKYSTKFLTIEVIESKTTINVSWKGKSIEREPSKFLSPILSKIIDLAAENNKRIVMDFRSLSYMNSSTITPVIKILERAKKGITKLSVLYQKALKWQELNFSALEIFETNNNQIEIKGL